LSFRANAGDKAGGLYSGENRSFAHAQDDIEYRFTPVCHSDEHSEEESQTEHYSSQLGLTRLGSSRKHSLMSSFAARSQIIVIIIEPVGGEG